LRAIIALKSDKTLLGDTATIAMLLRRTELEEESVDVYAVLRGAEADGSIEAGAVPVTWGVERRREAPSSPAGHEHSAPAVFGSPLEMSAARPEVPTLRERCLAIGGVATRFRTQRCGIHDIHSTWRDPLTASDGARLVGERHHPRRGMRIRMDGSRGNRRRRPHWPDPNARVGRARRRNPPSAKRPRRGNSHPGLEASERTGWPTWDRALTTVLLVDDHAVVRAGLKALLEASGRVEVVGEASSGEEAVRKTRSLGPDIVVMDLAMPGMDGVQATRRITALDLGTKVLVLTIHDEDEFPVPAIEGGAAGFLNKSAADTDLLGALEAVARGHSYLPRRATALIARRKAMDKPRGAKGIEILSSRERTAVELCARGFTARETASEMLVSPKTVEGYIGRAKSKLGLDNRRDIVRFALESGLLRAEE